MDESMKHRVVGIAVIISIALIFVPAMIKKNNQRLDEDRIAVELPAKPPQPQLEQVDETKVFAETKVAHVNLDTQLALNQTEQEIKQHPISEPQPISIQQPQQASYPLGNGKNSSEPKGGFEEKKDSQKSNHELVKLNKQVKPAPAPKLAQVKTITPKSNKGNSAVRMASAQRYAVQIGVFSETTNAQSLQNKLNKKGIHSRLVQTTVRGKPAVKVLIGQLATVEAAQQLQVKLTNEHNLKGFVTKGVG